MGTETGVVPESEAVIEGALASIDEVNAEDPVRIEISGEEWPKELVHADRMSHWLEALDPRPSAAQRLAARAHHLRRWAVPRAEYPEGRAGYLRWRSHQARRQAEEVEAILRDAGVSPVTIERVQTIITKKNRADDPMVQTHEDALCLVFLELQLDELAGKLGHDRTVDVLRKTAAKMSERAIAKVAEVGLSDAGSELVVAALADPGSGPATEGDR